MQHGPFTSPPDAAIFGRVMLFDISFLADWNRIGDYRQHKTELNTECENKSSFDYDYKVDGQSQQFIQIMERSGLNAEVNLKD